LSSNGGDVENVKDAATRGKLLSQMGTVYEKMGDHKMAFSCFQESIQLLTSTHRDDRELSNALNSMGNLLRSDSNNDRALDCYDKSLTIRDQLGDELMIANTKNNIGAVLAAVKVFDRAMAFSAQALRIKTDRLGCECVETGRALVNVS
jgi:tetratricopeptide (TPR) repeat protein